MKVIRVKNENCVGRGQICRCLEERGGLTREEPCGDCHEEKLTKQNVRELRAAARKAGAGEDLYLFACARTIEENL